MLSNHKGRAIIIPVAEQIGAIIGPITTEPLKPQIGDLVVLISSKPSKEKNQSDQNAEKIKDILNSDPDVKIEVIHHENEHFLFLNPETLKKVKDHVACRDTLLLVNGGTGRWQLDIIHALQESQASSLSYVQSRDQQMLVLNHNGVVTEEKIVQNLGTGDTGRDKLLSYLSLEYKKKLLRPVGSNDSLSVAELYEKAGFLFAVLDCTKWDKSTYRTTLLSYHRNITRFGLENRRIFLHNLNRSAEEANLKERAREDGVAVPSTAAGLSQWKAELKTGDPFSWVEKRYVKALTDTGTPKDTIRNSANSPWTGCTLIVVMGSQPGSTLMAIWAHQPSKLVLLYDGQSVLSRRGARMLSENEQLGQHCTTITCIAIPKREKGAGNLDNLLLEFQDKRVVVNDTPGDKYIQTLLRIWALKDLERREIWSLAMNKVVQWNTDAAMPVAAIPVDSWVKAHSPGKVDFPQHRVCSVDDRNNYISLFPVSQGILSWFAARKRGTEYLANLRERGRMQGNNTLADKTLFILKDEFFFPSRNKSTISINKAAVQSVSSHFSNALFNSSSGNWFEFIVASALIEAAIEEVHLSAKTLRVSSPNTRDEMDVVTRHEGQFCYWECKTNSKIEEFYDYFLETRGSATRLLGRQSQAILVVPVINEGYKSKNGNTRSIGNAINDTGLGDLGFEFIGPGHLRSKAMGYIISSKMLADESSGQIKSSSIQDIAKSRRLWE